MSIVIASCLVVLTTFIHAAAMVTVFRGLEIEQAARRVRGTDSGWRKAAGWTTALIVAVVQRVYADHADVGERSDRSR